MFLLDCLTKTFHRVPTKSERQGSQIPWKSISDKCPSQKECRGRASSKSVSKKCPTRASYRSVFASCRARVPRKSVSEECLPGRPHLFVRQGCLTGVSYRSVFQDRITSQERSIRLSDKSSVFRSIMQTLPAECLRSTPCKRARHVHLQRVSCKAFSQKGSFKACLQKRPQRVCQKNVHEEHLTNSLFPNA